jgi:hypothetical protein
MKKRKIARHRAVAWALIEVVNGLKEDFGDLHSTLGRLRNRIASYDSTISGFQNLARDLGWEGLEANEGQAILLFMRARVEHLMRVAKDHGWKNDGYPEEHLEALLVHAHKELDEIDKMLGLSGEGRTRYAGDRVTALGALLLRSHEARGYGVP